jgi:hypothetical protein
LDLFTVLLTNGLDLATITAGQLIFAATLLPVLLSVVA